MSQTLPASDPGGKACQPGSGVLISVLATPIAINPFLRRTFKPRLTLFRTPKQKSEHLTPRLLSGDPLPKRIVIDVAATDHDHEIAVSGQSDLSAEQGGDGDRAGRFGS